MKIIHTKNDLSGLLKERQNSGKIVGLVPTMGAIHHGHLSLVERAKRESDVVVVSIFVNPTQFDNPSDLAQYPSGLEADVEMLRQNFDDLIVFAPRAQEIYGDEIKAEHFDFGQVASVMEGRYRAGHFDGVGTVLSKLFQIIKPDKAFFGEKDYQQLLIVKKLIKILDLPIEIVGCSISREADGLAESSRNKRLSATERQKANLLYKSLKKAQKNFDKENFDQIVGNIMADFEADPDFDLVYFEIADAKTLAPAKQFEENTKYRAFIAAKLGDVRLIDNLALN